MKILLIEDNPDDVFFIREMLREATGSFAVHHTDRLSTGLERLEEQEQGIDLILLDLSLPDSHGFDTFVRVHDRAPDLPIVVLSGLDDEALAVEAVRQGAQDYLVKGKVDADLLERAVRYAVERKRIKTELQESEARYRAIVQDQTELICRFRPDGTLTFVNDAYCRYYQKSHQDLIGRPFASSILEQDREEICRLLDSLESEKPVATFENRARTPSGSLRWQHWTYRVIFGARGAPIEFQAVGRDVTEKKEAEEALRYRVELEKLVASISTLFIQLAADDFDDGIAFALQAIGEFMEIDRCAIWERTEDGTQLINTHEWHAKGVASQIQNRQALPIEGFSWSMDRLGRFQVVQIPRVAELPPDAEAEKGLLSAQSVRSFAAVPMAYGTLFKGFVSLDLVRSERRWSEDTLAFIKIVAEILVSALERRRTEQALRDLNANLSAQVAARTAEIAAEKEKSEVILRSVGDAIAVVSLDLCVQYINRAFTRLTGYTAQEARGFDTTRLIGGRLSVPSRRSLKRALAEGQIWEGEVIVRRKDGRTYDASLTVAPIRDAEGVLTGYVTSHRDISERKRLDRARAQFVTNVSHELRTPVTNLKLYTALVQRKDPPEKLGGYLKTLDDQVDLLIELIQDILKIADLDSGRAVMDWELISMPTIVDEVTNRFKELAENSGLTLKARPVPPDLPPIKGDRLQLDRALTELVDNAVTFTPQGGQVILEVDSAGQAGQNWVTVAVSDTGPGLSAEEQERIFDRFYRGRLAESGHISGTGLGLSVAQEIALAHGGKITVQSEVDRGSTFVIWLPAANDITGENQ